MSCISKVCVCLGSGAGVGGGRLERWSAGFVVSDRSAPGREQDVAQQPVHQRDDGGGHTETRRCVCDGSNKILCKFSQRSSTGHKVNTLDHAQEFTQILSETDTNVELRYTKHLFCARAKTSPRVLLHRDATVHPARSRARTASVRTDRPQSSLNLLDDTHQSRCQHNTHFH